MNVKYTLKQFDEDTMSEVTSEFYAEDLDQICEQITKFLRGSGFEFEGSVTVQSSEGEFNIDDWPDIGSDDDVFNDDDDEEFFNPNEKCSVCNMTRAQMNGHICFDRSCPFESND